MSNGHMHLGGPHMTQNQGNVLGDRPCVRQSRLYREQVGGNTMKDLLGQESLKWNTNQTEGAYSGGRVFDHVNQQYESGPRQPQQRHGAPLQPKVVNQGGVEGIFSGKADSAEAHAPTSHRRGAGHANRQTYNFLTGQ